MLCCIPLFMFLILNKITYSIYIINDLSISFNLDLSDQVKFYSLKSLAQMIYIDYYLIFIIVGFILLTAMLGSIVLTSKRSINIKEQNLFEQTKRYF